MQDKGAQLESLVAGMEEYLLPAGFTILPRERVYDDDGNQVAEFDIHITGTVGSSTVNWLIECRDRPSSGAAPVSWIEQLVGRQGRFRFDKVFAVSTTGFAVGAREYAERSGIVLRTVETIADLAADFQVQTFHTVFRNVDTDGPMKVAVETSTPGTRRIPVDQWQVRWGGATEYRPMEDFILQHMPDDGPLPRIGPDGLLAEIAGPYEEIIHRTALRYSGRLDVLVNEERLWVRELSVPWL